MARSGQDAIAPRLTGGVPSTVLKTRHGSNPVVSVRHPFNTQLAAEYTSLTRYARQFTSRPEYGADLVQETMLKAWASRNLFQQGTRLRPWLRRILKNTFLSHHRRSWRIVEDIDERYAHSLISEPTQYHACALREAERLMGRLSHDHREIILMVGVSGQSCEEAATALNCPVGTIKSRLGRARHALRETRRTHAISITT